MKTYEIKITASVYNDNCPVMKIIRTVNANNLQDAEQLALEACKKSFNSVKLEEIKEVW